VHSARKRAPVFLFLRVCSCELQGSSQHNGVLRLRVPGSFLLWIRAASPYPQPIVFLLLCGSYLLHCTRKRAPVSFLPMQLVFQHLCCELQGSSQSTKVFLHGKRLRVPGFFFVMV
jgi:hypothetical protein